VVIGYDRAVLTRIASFAAVVGALAASILATPALAIENPLSANVTPIGGGGVHGAVTFFQLGTNVNVGLNLDNETPGTAAVDLRKGTCKNYSQSSRWPLGTFSGTSDETRLPNTKLESLVGQVLLVHKTQSVDSPPIGCAEIH
jgi:hypothetical protein